MESEDESLTGETDESYTINIQKSPGKKVKCEESRCGINLFIVHPIDRFLKLMAPKV